MIFIRIGQGKLALPDCHFVLEYLRKAQKLKAYIGLQNKAKRRIDKGRWFHIWISPSPIQHEWLSFILLIIFLCRVLAVVFMPRNQQHSMEQLSLGLIKKKSSRSCP
jgi:uncharacterized protein YpmS